MANYNRITESKYNTVKILLRGGASIKEAAEYMSISEVTVYTIKNAETYTEYENIVAAKRYSRKKNVEAAKPEQPETPVISDDKQKGGTLSANYQINRIYEVLKHLDETMTLVSNKLGYIVDELTK